MTEFAICVWRFRTIFIMFLIVKSVTKLGKILFDSLSEFVGFVSLNWEGTFL